MSGSHVPGGRRARPVLSVPLSPLERGLEFFAFLVLLASLLLLLISWPGLPARIPTHFDGSGAPDAYGSKAILFLLPGILVGLYLLFSVLGRFPQIFNYPWAITEENAERQYQMARTMLRALKLEIGLTFGYILWFQIQSAQSKVSSLNIGLVAFILVMMFGTVGFYLWLAARAR